MTNDNVTYEQYSQWAEANNVQPYTRKQWDTTTEMHRWLISRQVRRSVVV